MSQQSFPTAWWSVKKNAPWRDDSELFVDLRMSHMYQQLTDILSKDSIKSRIQKLNLEALLNGVDITKPFHFSLQKRYLGKEKELTINTLSLPPTSANVTPDV